MKNMRNANLILGQGGQTHSTQSPVSGSKKSTLIYSWTRHTRGPRTFVFAAIQFEVSLSSSHFLIHFLSHCKRKKKNHVLQLLMIQRGSHFCRSTEWAPFTLHLTGSCQFSPQLKLQHRGHSRSDKEQDQHGHDASSLNNALTRTDGHTCISLAWRRGTGLWQHGGSLVQGTTLTVDCTWGATGQETEMQLIVSLMLVCRRT